MLTKQETLLGRDAQAESSRIGEPGGTTLPMRLAALSFMVIGLISRLSLANHSDLGSFLGVCMAQPRWMPVRRILGGGRIHVVSF